MSWRLAETVVPIEHIASSVNTLRTAPAMAAGVTDRLGEASGLVALSEAEEADRAA